MSTHRFQARPSSAFRNLELRCPRRTIQLLHSGCGCDLCAPVASYVVVHEYELREPLSTPRA
jgi:hypothetical protein